MVNGLVYQSPVDAAVTARRHVRNCEMLRCSAASRLWTRWRCDDVHVCIVSCSSWRCPAPLTYSPILGGRRLCCFGAAAARRHWYATARLAAGRQSSTLYRCLIKISFVDTSISIHHPSTQSISRRRWRCRDRALSLTDACWLWNDSRSMQVFMTQPLSRKLSTFAVDFGTNARYRGNYAYFGQKSFSTRIVQCSLTISANSTPIS